MTDRDGITLPGAFLPWSLSAALAATVTLVWLQRRRRHTPTSPDDNPTDLPPPLLHLAHEVARNPALPTAPDLAERAATLTTLIGADAAALGPWPRLCVADDLEHALALVETRLLHRARLLDDYQLTDLDTLRHHAPDEEPLPPVVLISEPPPPGTRMRLKTALGLGTDTGLTALLLGDWPHTPTLRIDPDGHTHTPDDGSSPDEVPERVAVMDIDTTLAALTTLREAHTGRRSTPTTPTDISAQPTSRDVPEPDSRPGDSPTPPVAERASTGSIALSSASPAGLSDPVHKARLRVFGTPHIEDVTAPGQPLRAKAAEIAVFLACHPDGASTHALGDHLEPGIRHRSADVRVHTNVSSLRHVLGRAAGPRRNGYVIKTAGRYRLDPTTVTVGLWELSNLLSRAETTTDLDQRLDLLRRACDLYTAPLADDCDYDWIEPHRETARQQATTAHTLLAETQLPHDPTAAVTTLDREIAFDPYKREPLPHSHARQSRHQRPRQHPCSPARPHHRPGRPRRRTRRGHSPSRPTVARWHPRLGHHRSYVSAAIRDLNTTVWTQSFPGETPDFYTPFGVTWNGTSTNG